MAEPSTSPGGAPRILVVTSARVPGDAVTPVLAALEAAGGEIRALDVGKMSARATWRVWQTVVGELAERRLHQELAESPPDVALAFDPAAVKALAAARDEAQGGAPVVAVVPDLEPDASWGDTDADRYLAIDEEAAVALADAGVADDRIIPVGPLGERAFAEAAAEPRQLLRERFKLGGGPIVLVQVAGLGGELASQLALQLSLIPGRPLFLFDAGGDTDAAQTLRSQVPTLDIRAKLFGTTRDAPRLWRAADVVIARPMAKTVARALILGARLVGLSPEGDDQLAAIEALEARKLARGAANPLLIASAIEPLLSQSARTDDRIAADGAETVADAAYLIAAQKEALLEEIHAARRAERSARVDAATTAAETQQRRARAAGDLEDLGGAAEPADVAPDIDRAEIEELIRQIARRTEKGKKRLIEARQAADSWQKRADEASRAGDDAAAKKAQSSADRERARMHETLAELAELEKEMTRLRRARSAAQSAPRKRPAAGARASAGSAKAKRAKSPSGRGRELSSVDELLERLKREQASGRKTSPTTGGDIDDELEALKRKVEDRRRRR